ncbi:hypothetical protein [Falsihalocynthiibacter sp. CO-5D18]|uniref:hypothetical protein n=1 Tax=Falsihalocynthiibacter sp. CO-5D18 TaxID=3240872 RepID=UPI00350EF4B1
MKKIVLPLICAVFLAAGSVDAEDFGLSDVKGWLDGCIALTVGKRVMTQTMEYDCLAQADKYCSVGRSVEFQDSCKNDLTDQLRADIQAVLPLLKPIEEMKAIYRKRFQERAGKLLNQDRSSCNESISTTECEFALIGVDWLMTRSLAREIGLTIGENPN